MPRMGESGLVILIFAAILAFLAGRKSQQLARSVTDVKMARAGVKRMRSARTKAAPSALIYVVAAAGFLAVVFYLTSNGNGG